MQWIKEVESECNSERFGVKSEFCAKFRGSERIFNLDTCSQPVSYNKNKLKHHIYSVNYEKASVAHKEMTDIVGICQSREKSTRNSTNEKLRPQKLRHRHSGHEPLSVHGLERVGELEHRGSGRRVRNRRRQHSNARRDGQMRRSDWLGIGMESIEHRQGGGRSQGRRRCWGQGHCRRLTGSNWADRSLHGTLRGLGRRRRRRRGSVNCLKVKDFEESDNLFCFYRSTLTWLVSSVSLSNFFPQTPEETIQLQMCCFVCGEEVFGVAFGVALEVVGVEVLGNEVGKVEGSDRGSAVEVEVEGIIDWASSAW